MPDDKKREQHMGAMLFVKKKTGPLWGRSSGINRSDPMLNRAEYSMPLGSKIA